MFGKMQASGLTEFSPFQWTSAIEGQSSFLVHLASCIPQLLWGVTTSVGSQFGEPSFTYGGQTLLMAVTFLVYWYGRKYFHFTWSYLTNVHVFLVHSRVRLCDPVDWSPLSSSVHGIFQARVQEWVAISFSGSSQPRSRTRVSYVSCIGRQILYHWVTWEAHLRNQ